MTPEQEQAKSEFFNKARQHDSHIDEMMSLHALERLENIFRLACPETIDAYNKMQPVLACRIVKEYIKDAAKWEQLNHRQRAERLERDLEILQADVDNPILSAALRQEARLRMQHVKEELHRDLARYEIEQVDPEGEGFEIHNDRYQRLIKQAASISLEAMRLCQANPDDPMVSEERETVQLLSENIALAFGAAQEEVIAEVNDKVKTLNEASGVNPEAVHRLHGFLQEWHNRWDNEDEKYNE